MNSIIFLADSEMQDAINELNQAQTMLDNASDEWRIDEAIARLNAANFRIRAIRHEKGGVK